MLKVYFIVDYYENVWNGSKYLAGSDSVRLKQQDTLNSCNSVSSLGIFNSTPDFSKFYIYIYIYIFIFIFIIIIIILFYFEWFVWCFLNQTMSLTISHFEIANVT